MCGELTSTSSMGNDGDLNPQPYDCKAHTLTTAPSCYQALDDTAGEDCDTELSSATAGEDWVTELSSATAGVDRVWELPSGTAWLDCGWDLPSGTAGLDWVAAAESCNTVFFACLVETTTLLPAIYNYVNIYPQKLILINTLIYVNFWGSTIKIEVTSMCMW